jgi:hypothetical protein
MRISERCVLAAGLLSLPFLVSPDVAQANTTYSYIGNASGNFFVNVTFETTLTGAQLANLASGTDITASIVSFLMTSPPPPTDTLGFPVGVFNFEPPFAVEIGTNAAGNITSWDINEILFASYPAVPGEDPFDFFCRYRVTTSTSVDQRVLTEDNNAGLCPGDTRIIDNPGTWTQSSVIAVPEPGSLAVLASGLAVWFAARRRKS